MDTIIANLILRLTAASLRPRIISVPTESSVLTLPEAGVHLFVRSPRPFAQAGAGRYGYKTERDVGAVVVSTPTLRDPGGRDDHAVKAQLAAELAVVDAMLDFNRTPIDTGAVMVRWVPGGDEIVRWVKTNPGMIVSGLMFTVTYVPVLTV